MIEKFGSLDEDQNRRFIEIKMKAEQEVLKIGKFEIFVVIVIMYSRCGLYHLCDICR